MKRYEIWWARVKFEDSPEVKKRPVLIWNDCAFVLIAYKMTSTDRGDNRDEFKVEYWKEAGLTKETTIRITSVLRLEKADLVSQIGELDYRDRLRFELRIAG